MSKDTADDDLLGVWIIGARGSVATTTIVGGAALAAGLAEPTGCVTALPAFSNAGLPGFGSLRFSGFDVVGTPLRKRAEQLAQSGVVPGRLLDSVNSSLDTVDQEIRMGIVHPQGNQLEQASRLIEAIESFRAQRGLRGVVVVNVSSTEPQPAGHPAFGSLDALRSAMASESPVLPVSALYAFSALSAKCAYLDFTPSGAMQIPALQQLASVNGVPYAGNDGKTGETLVKSALAPMFTHRALKVRSWSGTNLLGGGDGATLADPDAAASKTASKARSLASILGYATEGQVHIDNVAELGDWKTAWNHISFEGFLGVRMTMQFTWQGCDSALAAPLVLDLVRLLGRALELGASGPQPQFGFFFKDPVGCEDHRLVAQYEELIAWVEAASRAPAVPDSAGAA